MARSKFSKGQTVTIEQDTPAWYSGYGMNPHRIIRAGELLTIQSVDVPYVRGRNDGRYDVARTEDGWQISTVEARLERVS